MQEVRIVRWCDECLKSDGIKVPAGGGRQISIDDMKADIDLCEEHDKTYIHPLLSLLKAIGSRTEQPAPKPSEDDDSGRRPPMLAQCPIDGTWMDVRSRVSHTALKHEEYGSAGKIDWRFGEQFAEVFLCTCGLAFPAQRGRDMHSRHKNSTPECGIPEDDSPVPPLRPI